MPVQKIGSVPSSSAASTKKPTMLQYVKNTEESNLKEHYLITKVWFPGKYKNVTLETDNFRCLVYPHQEEYEAILDFLSGYFETDDYIVYITLEDTVNGDWCFSCNMDEVAHWRHVSTLKMFELERVTRRKVSKKKASHPAGSTTPSGEK